MKELSFFWQKEDWMRLQAQRTRMPHAWLMHGAPGIGKRALAEHFAVSLLCENPAQGGHPCGACRACGWMAQGNHPDFRAVLPEILQTQAALEDAGESGAEGGDRRGAGRGGSGGGGSGSGGSSKTKTPSREIKIEQIRSLDSFFNIGTHRGGARVVLVYPADALNVPASNALLKTLEEPSPGTVFLLVTSHPDQLLATIRSRAAKFQVHSPAPAAALAWLQAQGVRQPEQRLAEAGGAPLMALTAAEADAHSAERDTLIDALAASGSGFDPLALAEKCDKAGNENLVLWLMRWVSDMLLAGQSGGAPRYHPAHAAAVAKSAASFDMRALHRYYRGLAAARRVASHPLNPRLFAEGLLIDYARLARRV